MKIAIQCIVWLLVAATGTAAAVIAGVYVNQFASPLGFLVSFAGAFLSTGLIAPTVTAIASRRTSK